MPFKTKRQKIAASQRRFTYTPEKYSLPAYKEKPNPGRSLVAQGSMQSNANIMLDMSNLRSEVLKILFISLVIIILQVGLRLTLF